MSQEIEDLEEEITVQRNTIEFHRPLVELGKKAEELRKNPLYDLIINTEYSRDYAARLAHMVSDMTYTANQREAIISDLHGIGSVTRFVNGLVTQGRQSEDIIKSCEAEINALLEDIDNVEAN